MRRAADGPQRQGAPRRLWDRTPLWARLVATAGVLVALALTLTGVVGTRLLHGYLLDQVDKDLVQTTQTLGHGHPPIGADQGRAPTPYYAAATDAEGSVLATYAAPMHGSRPALPAGRITDAGAQPFSVAGQSTGGGWRVLVTPITFANHSSGYLVVAYNTSSVDATVGRLLLIDVAVGAAVLVALAAAGYLLVRASLRPLGEIEATAASIAGGELSLRVPDHDGRTEVGRLSRALNGMLSQIEMAFRQRERSEAAARESEDRMRRFVADASHELRTPLTSIRGFAELYRQRGGDDASQPMQRIEAAATRMGLLVDDLLLLARLDQQRPLRRESVDLVAIAADAVIDTQAMAPGRSVELEPIGIAEGDPVMVEGDEQRLRQVLANLVGNAITHTPPEVPVRVGVGVTDSGGCRVAVLQVADDGPGLAPAQAERVFERFYRADAARGRSSGGSGLGLSIVASLAIAHGGLAEVETAPGRGATFRVLLPLRQD